MSRGFADIMASMLEQGSAAGELDLGEVAYDDLPFDLLRKLAVESEPRMERMLDLLRERGWAHWIRPEQLAHATINARSATAGKSRGR